MSFLLTYLSNEAAFSWNSELETGIERIDNQHIKIFKLARNLVTAIADGKGNDVIMQTLEFLTSYVSKHFSDEERLQAEYNYPDYATHRIIHEEFKDKIAKLAGEIGSEGPSDSLVEEVCVVVSTWLFRHIKGDDFQVAAFIKAEIEERDKVKLAV